MIFRTLRICIFSFYAFLFFRSLADAKMLKYIPQHLIRRNLSYDIRQMEYTLPQILRDEIPGKAGVQTFLYPMYSFQRMRKRLEVAGIRYDDVALVEGGDGRYFREELL